MLASAGTIEIVAETLKEYDVKAIVLDPVRRGSALSLKMSTYAKLIRCIGNGVH